MPEENVVNSPLNPENLLQTNRQRFTPQKGKPSTENEKKSQTVETILQQEPATHQKTKEVEVQTPIISVEKTEIAPVVPQSNGPKQNGKAPIGLVNQASTIKISKEAKRKFDAIRIVMDNPPAYQLLEQMMNVFYEQELDSEQKIRVDANTKY